MQIGLVRPGTIHARRVAAFNARRGALGDQRRQARADWSADRGARPIVHTGSTGRRCHASVVDAALLRLGRPYGRCIPRRVVRALRARDLAWLVLGVARLQRERESVRAAVRVRKGDLEIRPDFHPLH